MSCTQHGSLTHYFLEEGKNLWEKSVYPCFRADRCSFIFATETYIDHFIRGPPVLRFKGKRGTKTGGRKNGEKTNRFGTEPIYGIPDGGGGK